LRYDPKEMLRSLEKQHAYDDLEELRKLIRVTDKNLRIYSGEVI
jgi:hypothetical protein